MNQAEPTRNNDKGGQIKDGQLVILDEQTCWDRLTSGTVGRLAVCVGTHPDIFPVRYTVAGRSVIFRTEAGTKLAGAVLGPAVSFEIDAVDERHHAGWSIVVHGRAREAERLADLVELEELEFEPWTGRGNRWVMIHVDNISGREISHLREIAPHDAEFLDRIRTHTMPGEPGAAWEWSS